MPLPGMLRPLGPVKYPLFQAACPALPQSPKGLSTHRRMLATLRAFCSAVSSLPMAWAAGRPHLFLPRCSGGLQAPRLWLPATSPMPRHKGSDRVGLPLWEQTFSSLPPSSPCTYGGVTAQRVPGPWKVPAPPPGVGPLVPASRDGDQEPRLVSLGVAGTLGACRRWRQQLCVQAGVREPRHQSLSAAPGSSLVSVCQRSMRLSLFFRQSNQCFRRSPLALMPRTTPPMKSLDFPMS